jgi:VWFA-related protein
MNNLRLNSILCCTLFWGAALQNGYAWQSQAPEPVPTAGTSRRIALDVAVTDGSGHPVSGLQQQDFTLLDNKQPSNILSFDAVQGDATTPVEVILLIDGINTSFTHVAYERLEIEKFLKRNEGKLARPTSVVVLSDSGAGISNVPTQDGNALLTQMNQNQSGLRSIGRSTGAYGADERVQRSLHALGQLIENEGKRPGRKLLVWISPGWPLLSGPRIELGPKAQQALFSNIISLSDGLRRARITLYSIDPLGAGDSGFRTFAYLDYVKPVKKADQVHIGNLALQVLVTQSGGRVLNSSNDIAGEIATCVADANAFYVLSLDGLPGDGPNEYHSLEVKVDKPKTMARTRSGYYAQP